MTKVNFNDLSEFQRELVQMYIKVGSKCLGIQFTNEGSFVVFN
jgi:hypothetical protein